jgi:nucleoside-diphosphate-sugar epimerase
MKILIVGGAGYIGGAVTDLLAGSSHQVRVYDLLLYEEAYRKSLPFVYGDIRDRAKLIKHLKWADAVIWLAALVGDQACEVNPSLAQEINADSVKWLCKNYNGRIIFLSTCSVYGEHDKEVCETSPVKPLSVYASSKLDGEKYLKNKNALIFRLGTIFGVGDIFSRIRLDLVVNILTVKAYTYGKIKVFGGNQHRPLLHVKDAARAITENIDKKETGLYNLKYKNMKIIKLAEVFKEHFPKLEIEKTQMHFQDNRNYKASGEKAQKKLRFKPVYTIDDGIEEIKTLLIEGRIKDVENPRYKNHGFLKKNHKKLFCD